ncbi:MAG: PHP domain-containing protein, partial [Desulfobacterales bacterium]
MIPLTVRSYYSLMWGLCSPKKICAATKQLGYNRLALTETDNLYGLWSFLKHCKHENIRPIVGAELTDPVSGYRAVCLAENDQGYRNLCRLITCRHIDETFDLTTAVPVHSRGLFTITQSSELLTNWYDAGVNVAAAVARKPDEAAFRLRRVSHHINVPMIATPGSFFLDRKEGKVHRMLRAIDLNTTLSRLTPKDTAPPDAWLASASEYIQRFAVWPDVIEATRAVAERLTFTGPCNGLVLPPWHDKQGRNAEQLLRKAAYEGAPKRYGNDL